MRRCALCAPPTSAGDREVDGEHRTDRGGIRGYADMPGKHRHMECGPLENGGEWGHLSRIPPYDIGEHEGVVFHAAYVPAKPDPEFKAKLAAINPHMKGRHGMQFRKKPVVITARRAIAGEDIHTLEGTMRADRGDWIITGVNGEQYPCKPDIFRRTYDPADEDAADAWQEAYGGVVTVME